MCSNTSATEVLLPGHFRDCGSTVIGESSSTSPSSTKRETSTPLLGIPQKIQKFITRWVQKHCTMKGFGCTSFCSNQFLRSFLNTLQGTKISHLGKKKIIFKHALGGHILVSRRVNHVFRVIQYQLRFT